MNANVKKDFMMFLILKIIHFVSHATIHVIIVQIKGINFALHAINRYLIIDQFYFQAIHVYAITGTMMIIQA